MPFYIRTDLPPFGPDPAFNPYDPVGSPIGEEQRAPVLHTTPGGGGGVKRRLVCKQCQVLDWLRYYTSEQPLDPYCLNGVLWEFTAEPFEKQLRISTTAIESVFPGLAYYELAVLNLTYDSTGNRWYPGFGVVKEEQKPRMHQAPVGVVRGAFTESAPNASGQPGTLEWTVSDGGTNAESETAIYYGEAPHLEVGSREILVTFPFAPTGNEPLAEGVVNSDIFQLPVSGDICPASTLKYVGCAKEASVVIPSVGIYTGLMRYRKTFVFHYLNAKLGNTNTYLRWNSYWRARDQSVGPMKDMTGQAYLQYTPWAFSSCNWWL